MGVVAALLAIGGCGEPINTGSAWAPNTVATQTVGRTFAWATLSNAPTGGPDIQDIREMVHRTIEDELLAKGYQKSESEPADFWVAARLSRSPQGDARAEVPFEEYTEGSLFVYVVNPATRQWLWRSWADTRLNPSNPPDVKRKRLEQAVRMMLKSLPSSGKQGPAAER